DPPGGAGRAHEEPSEVGLAGAHDATTTSKSLASVPARVEERGDGRFALRWWDGHEMHELRPPPRHHPHECRSTRIPGERVRELDQHIDAGLVEDGRPLLRLVGAGCDEEWASEGL